ncbi:MAG: DUF2344 domain-containing protein [Ruminococcus sp.]|nr:DUF2344 domain-containing protein [Ruminococcus sp.]
MRNVRVFFKKFAECRYISHLDLNRVMLRAVGKSRLNVWRTEGFNQHAYITFALPLSLGFSSERESMDFRLLDDEMDLSLIPDMLNACLPQGIRVFDCQEAKYKPADIDSALYEAVLTSDDTSVKELYTATAQLLESDEIPVEKKTKKGFKTVNLKEYVRTFSLSLGESSVTLSITLPAGSSTNINPTLFVTALEKKTSVEIFYDISRKEIYTKEGEPFA